MRRDPRADLADIVDAGDPIATFLDGRAFDDYLSDKMN